MRPIRVQSECSTEVLISSCPSNIPLGTRGLKLHDYFAQTPELPAFDCAVTVVQNAKNDSAEAGRMNNRRETYLFREKKR